MDSEIVLDGKPSELFPVGSVIDGDATKTDILTSSLFTKPYNIPRAPVLSKKEEKQVSYFLLFREQCHDGPLYTQARTWKQTIGKPARTYGQEQINSRYGQTSKATIDPFNAVPTYSQKFNQVERSLPDLESRPFAKEFFPPELHATLDGDDLPTTGPAHKKRRTGPKTIALSNITSLKTAEELFLPGEEQTTGQKNGTASYDKALQALNTVEKRNEDGDDQGILSGEDDDDWVKNPDDEDGEGHVEEDDAYEDESGDDYNAEAYFDGNQDDDDYDEGGDEGGDYI